MDGRQRDLVRLVEWLRAEVPSEVPMVCAVGTKAPKFRHRDGEWDWDDYDTFFHDTYKDRAEKMLVYNDVGILLSRMCVVDVDDAAVAHELEQAFPQLSTAPCEATAKGRHYFFLRSETADQEGFYDGAAQVQRGVDFKSICHNGTRGFVVVAPSTGKQWLRALWDGPLQPIGDELLRRVASPRHPHIPPVCLEFRDGTVSLHADRVTRQATRLEPVWGAHAAVRAPDNLGVHTLTDLLFTCHHGVPKALLPACHIERQLQLAMHLGLPPEVLRAFRPGGSVGCLLQVQSVWPAMAAAMHAEALFRVGQGDEAVRAEPVGACDDMMDDASGYPEGHGARLFAGHSGQAMQLLDRPQVPDFVREWLQQYPGELVLAGGGALAAAVDMDIPPGDYDFFVCGATEERALHICRTLASQCVVLYRTCNAITLKPPAGSILVQIVLRRYESHEHLLASFDIQPCKVLVVHDEKHGLLVAKALPSWRLAMAGSCMVLDPSMWGAASFLRVLKYAARGFQVVIPCLVREHVLRKTLWRANRGVGLLLAFAAKLKHPGLPTADEAAQAALTCYRRSPVLMQSDYDVYMRLTGRLWHWVRALWDRIVGRRTSWLTRQRLPLAPRNSNFHPRSPCWHLVFDASWTRQQLMLFTEQRSLHALVVPSPAQQHQQL